MIALLSAERLKLRTLPGVLWCLFVMAGALVGLALAVSSGAPAAPSYVDEFRFVHRPLNGDGMLTARLLTQEATHPWAMAGVMVKAGPVAGAPYAALLTTPGHGTRLQSALSPAVPAARPVRDAPAAGGRWMRLARAGTTVTAAVSGDGRSWVDVGTAPVPAGALEVGLFVTSPGATRSVPVRPAMLRTRPSTATFDTVTLTEPNPPPGSAGGSWRATDVGAHRPSTVDDVAVDGVVAVTGSGDILGRADDGSRVAVATTGTILAMLPAVVIGTLVVSAEYRGATALATFAACPRRGRVLAAKALVAGSSVFGTAAVACLAALLLAQPLLRGRGFTAPDYPAPPPLDALRVVLGTAAVLALLALVGLGLATALRRGAAAIGLLAAALYVPVVLTPLLPESVARWWQRSGPLAGLAVQRMRETDDGFLLPWPRTPWVGLAVLCAWAAAALAAGYVTLRRRDV